MSPGTGRRVASTSEGHNAISLDTMQSVSTQSVSTTFSSALPLSLTSHVKLLVVVTQTDQGMQRHVSSFFEIFSLLSKHTSQVCYGPFQCQVMRIPTLSRYTAIQTCCAGAWNPHTHTLMRATKLQSSLHSLIDIFPLRADRSALQSERLEVSHASILCCRLPSRIHLFIP